jgi:outer membrane protein assembly factor BamB
MRRTILWFLLGFAVALLVAVIGFVWSILRPPPAPPPPVPVSGLAVVWTFEAPEPGGLVAAPWVAGDTIFVSAVLARGLHLAGAVYAVDPATGKRRWTFDAGREMRPVASAPVRAGDRVYVGEGMHNNPVCHLYCLDAATGAPFWAYQANDHIESTPAVADGTVYFGAGNDGVYALDAATGGRRWQFADGLHIDASPFVAGGRVFVGSGTSRTFNTLQVVALDAASGKPVWRHPVDLPAWGSPRVAGGRVFVGLGNGRLTEGAQPPEEPAGALLCLDAKTGQKLWRFDAGDAVFQQPAVVDDRVYFGSRDGHLYAVAVASGELIYRVPMGGPVIAPPAVADDKVYAVTLGGLLRCLDAADGRELWRFDLKERTRADPLVVAGVRVAGGRVYLAAELRIGGVGLASLFCLRP